MAGDDECQRADGEWFDAGHSGAHPGLRREVLEERDGGETDAPEFFNMRGPRDRIGLRTCGCDVRVVAGQWTVEGTGKPESSESECAFRIGNMIQNLADAPFAGSASVQGSLIRDRREYSRRILELVLDGLEG